MMDSVVWKHRAANLDFSLREYFHRFSIADFLPQTYRRDSLKFSRALSLHVFCQSSDCDSLFHNIVDTSRLWCGRGVRDIRGRVGWRRRRTRRNILFSCMPAFCRILCTGV